MGDYKPEKPNLDLIKMVQKARMMHDNEVIPSQVDGVYWIEAKDQSNTAQAPTAQAGQWTLNIDAQKVDAVWQIIKQATEQGQLGYKSKVSTASRNRGVVDTRLIYVRTYDKNDGEDVKRIRDMLAELGIAGNWDYQADS